MRRGTTTIVAKELISAEASKEYSDKVKEARKLMKNIDSIITKHSREQKKDPKDWGYVGDMGYIVELLNDASRFIKV